MILDLAAQVRSLVPQPTFPYSAFLLAVTSQLPTKPVHCKSGPDEIVNLYRYCLRLFSA
jgi:hypothetical protein